MQPPFMKRLKRLKRLKRMSLDLDLCNWALLKLGQPPIGDLADSSTRAGFCRTLLKPLHLSQLCLYCWSFARQQKVYTPSESRQSRYALPDDCLKILSVSDKVRCDASGLIDEREQPVDSFKLIFIKEVEIDRCSPLYQEALVSRLGCELCTALVADEQLKSSLKAEHEWFLAKAIDMDGIEVLELQEY